MSAYTPPEFLYLTCTECLLLVCNFRTVHEVYCCCNFEPAAKFRLWKKFVCCCCVYLSHLITKKKLYYCCHFRSLLLLLCSFSEFLRQCRLILPTFLRAIQFSHLQNDGTTWVFIHIFHIIFRESTCHFCNFYF